MISIIARNYSGAKYGRLSIAKYETSITPAADFNGSCENWLEGKWDNEKILTSSNGENISWKFQTLQQASSFNVGQI